MGPSAARDGAARCRTERRPQRLSSAHHHGDGHREGVEWLRGADRLPESLAGVASRQVDEDSTAPERPLVDSAGVARGVRRPSPPPVRPVTLSRGLPYHARKMLAAPAKSPTRSSRAPARYRAHDARGGTGGIRASFYLSTPSQKFGPNIAAHREGSDLLGAKTNLGAPVGLPPPHGGRRHPDHLRHALRGEAGEVVKEEDHLHVRARVAAAIDAEHLQGVPCLFCGRLRPRQEERGTEAVEARRRWTR